MNFFDPDEEPTSIGQSSPQINPAPIVSPAAKNPAVQSVGPTVNVTDNFGVMESAKQFVDPDEQAQKEYASSDPVDEPQFGSHLERDFGSYPDTPLGKVLSVLAPKNEFNPVILWTENSMIAHGVNAYRKGVFNKPMKELINDGREFMGKEVKNFSLKKLVNFAVSKPKVFAKELYKSVVADPELLLPIFWESLGGRLGMIGARLGKVGEATGKAAEVGLTGAGVGGLISSAQQLDEQGFINPAKLAQDMKINAGFAASLSVLGSIAGAMKKVPPKEIMSSADYHMQEGDDIMTAMGKAMEEHGVPKDKADELTSPLKNVDPDSDRNFLKLRKEVQLMLPPEESAAVMTPKQARADLGRMANELKTKRVSGEISDSDFAKMTEDLKKSEEVRVAKAEEPMPFHDPDIRDESVQEAAAAKERIQTGEAKAVGEEPSSLAARAKELMSKKTMSPSQAKELIDIKTYLEVLPEMGVATKEAAVMNPSQAKAFVESKLPETSLEVASKVEEPQLKLGETSLGMRQRGVMDPEMAKWIGLTLGGAAIGGYLSDDKAKGAMIGAALVLGGPIALKAARGMSKAADEAAEIGLKKFASLKRDPRIAKQVDSIISTHEGLLATRSLQADRHMYAINKLVPDAARQEEVIRAIQAGKIHTLKPNEQAAAVAHQEFVKDIGDRALAKGLVDSLIDDGTYITGLWKDSEKAKAIFSAASAETRFAKKKFIPDYDTGIALGLEPKTRNLGEIDNIYAKAMGRAESNKELIDTLKTVKVEGMNAKPLMTRAENSAAIAKLANKPNLNAAEQNELTTLTKYKPNPHPQLSGTLIHPDMVPSLSHVFYSTNIAPYLMTALAISAVAKTGLLSMTLFHDKSLLEVGLAMSLGMASAKLLPRIPSMYKMIRNGSAGDFAERAVGKGLKISHGGFDMDPGMVSKLLNTASSSIDKIPIAGKVLSLPTKGLEKLQEGNTWLLWNFLHPSAKLSTTSVAYEKALLKYAKIQAKDPAAKVPSPDQILEEVVHATNDLFGGINWRKVTDEVSNRWLHSQLTSLTNPEGQRALRVALLAPDWITSSVRSGYKGMKATVKGFIPGSKMSVADDMYRRYFLGGALMSAVIMEGMQQHYTGTHFWDNPDPLSVEYGDGTSINLFKHFGEIFHLMADPSQFAINKLGYLPKETTNQLLSKEYVSTKGMPPMQDTSITGRAAHAIKGMSPIAVQEIAAGHPGRALSGTLGLPTKGAAREERIANRQARAAERNSPEGRKRRQEASERRRKMRQFGY
jgi:hypothetical protein